MIRRIGDRLILVGVAHVLPKSIQEVEQAIAEEDPEVVGVELDSNRYVQLTNGSEAGKNIGVFSRKALLVRFLQYFQDKIGEQTGMMPGQEMLTAVDRAKESGARVELIDRDINVTLDRLLDKMGFWEKMKIIFSVAFSFLFGGEEIDLQNLTSGEIIDELLTSFREFSESAYNVLVEERDEYMANRISELLVFTDEKVLCVVGAGHVPGLTRRLRGSYDEGLFDSWGSYGFEWG